MRANKLVITHGQHERFHRCLNGKLRGVGARSIPASTRLKFQFLRYVNLLSMVGRGTEQKASRHGPVHATASSASTVVTVIAASAVGIGMCAHIRRSRCLASTLTLLARAHAGCSCCRHECCQRSRAQARDADSDPTERESPAALSTMAATETRARVQPVPDDLPAAPSGSGTVVGVLGFGFAAG